MPDLRHCIGVVSLDNKGVVSCHNVKFVWGFERSEFDDFEVCIFAVSLEVLGMILHVVLVGVNFLGWDTMDDDSIFGSSYFKAGACICPVYVS
jgi:hypothetical protein